MCANGRAWRKPACVRCAVLRPALMKANEVRDKGIMEDRAYFNQRIGRFGRVRRGVANATHRYAAGVGVLGVGVAALVLLSGWTANPFVNGVLALVVIGLWLGLLIRLARRWEGRRRILSEAFRLEALADDLNSRVVSAVDFLKHPQPSPLADVVIQKARQDLERPFERMINRTSRNRLRMRFVLLLVLFLLLGSTDRFGFDRAGRTVVLSAQHLREILFPTRFEVFPESGRHIYRVGTAVEAGIRFTRFGYPQVTLWQRTGGEDAETQTVLRVNDGTAMITRAPTLETEYRVRFAFGTRATEEITLVFAAAPVIENMQTELVYPLYTRLVPKEMDGIQDHITALSGTRVSMGFAFSKELNWAVMTFDDGERMPLDVVGRFASISFLHTQERQATLTVEDVHGFPLDADHTVKFGLTSDNPPKLFILPNNLRQDMPQSLDEFAGFTFSARVEDDFGAAKCQVKWRKSTFSDPNTILTQGDPVERVFLPPRPKALAVFENIFREQAQDAEAGDLFTFQVQAFDNRDPKPQSTVSPMFSIYIRGQGLEDGDAGTGPDVMSKFAGSGFKKIRRIIRVESGARDIRLPEALRPVDGSSNEDKGTRNTDTQRDKRGPRDDIAGVYGSALGAK